MVEKSTALYRNDRKKEVKANVLTGTKQSEKAVSSVLKQEKF